MPVSMDFVIPVNGIPRHKPAITHTTRKARNGLILKPAMSTTSESRARHTIISDME
jgi:hypothetical protein